MGCVGAQVGKGGVGRVSLGLGSELVRHEEGIQAWAPPRQGVRAQTG